MSKDQHLDGHILNLVQNFEIQEQSELQEHLAQRGYQIPQATLSRRLKKLNIAKVAGKYEIVDYNQPYLPIILDVKISDLGMIVLHTHPGNANSLAYYLDKKYVSYSPKENKSPAFLGTIAGDDTVLLIAKSKAATKEVIKLLQEDFPYLQSLAGN